MAIKPKILQFPGNSLMLLLSLGLLHCTDRNQAPIKQAQQASSVNSEGDYPSAILQNGLSRQYDKTRWAIYCLYAPDTCQFIGTNFSKDTVTFGELNLRFEQLRKSGDTVELYFNFYYKDTLKCNMNLINNADYFRGAGFLHGNDSASYWITPTTMLYFRPGRSQVKYTKPEQPNVIEYIKKNREKLNPWFKDEAKKRKIIL